MTAVQKTDLKNLTQEQLIDFVITLGQPAFRGRQILSWLYKPAIFEFSQMTDLAKDFRKVLGEHAYISNFKNPLIQVSRDKSVKFGFSLEDGSVIESVLIPEEDRSTLCLSTQVGCAMGCDFCMTGKMGFKRNLSPGEIVNQACAARQYCLDNDLPWLSNLVFMGMGEPLANLDNLLASLSLLTEQRGLDFAQRRITVSTCGLVPKMHEFGMKSDVNLAVSLHAVDDATRDKLMPINKKYPLAVLLEACRTFPMKKRQRIMFEYTMFSGINDSDDQAVQLAKLLRGIPCKINLLAVNPADSAYHSPSMERILAFQQILRKNNYAVFIRKSRGEDIFAACGQLAAQKEAICGQE